MLTKAILGELETEVPHQAIARHLRNHTGCGNGQAQAIAVDDRGLRQGKWEHRQAINQDMVR